MDGVLPLDKVVISDDLLRRPARLADYAAENEALVAIAVEMANPFGKVLKKLTDTALALCNAHSAGISLLERDRGHLVFRWHAVSGLWAGYEGGTRPRDSSPCGIVLDRNRFQLMATPEKHFSSMRDAVPPISEALLTPFCVAGETVGTIWVISHSDGRKFDPEDIRLMGSLATLAASAFVIRSSLQASGDRLRITVGKTPRRRATDSTLQ